MGRNLFHLVCLHSSFIHHNYYRREDYRGEHWWLCSQLCSVLRLPNLPYLLPIVPVLTQLAGETARALVENCFAERIRRPPQFFTLIFHGPQNSLDAFRAPKSIGTSLQ